MGCWLLYQSWWWCSHKSRLVNALYLSLFREKYIGMQFQQYWIVFNVWQVWLVLLWAAIDQNLVFILVAWSLVPSWHRSEPWHDLNSIPCHLIVRHLSLSFHLSLLGVPSTMSQNIGNLVRRETSILDMQRDRFMQYPKIWPRTYR